MDIQITYPEDVKIPIRAIPTTIFATDKEVSTSREGLIYYDDFLDILRSILKPG